MRRRINHRAKSPAPVPDREPIVVEVEPVEPEVMEDIMPFVISHEDEIINYIKDKATKETLKSLAPLLEKLEEAVKQQQAYQQQPAATAGPVPMSYEEQLKKLQETSTGKIKEKELKITERMNKLQMRFANLRK
ncbi:hypothetical protein [Chryseobacterium gregarium]|uniref:hypothetical protein n=1 Tax=Chryseobacterium gregarium TaxID=456299 RepID=UPI00048376CC|nr:hypothetical protein [Chryseobacterium gregarium]